MADIQSMDHMEEGQTATVAGIRLSGSMRRRLQDIGIIEGTNIKCLQKSPAGDPIAYLIRGAVIALRSEDSANVMMKKG